MTPADVEIKTIKINLEDTDYHFTGKFEKYLKNSLKLTLEYAEQFFNKYIPEN